MAKYYLSGFVQTSRGLSGPEGETVEAWQFSGDDPQPTWLPAVSHTVFMPHIGNPDWKHENFAKGEVWASAAYPEALYIGTPGGWHRCEPEDWITRSDNGDLRVVTPGEFATYYSAVREASA